MPANAGDVMSLLAELHAALLTLEKSGRTAKLYFYFNDPDGQRLHSGFFFVDKGRACYLSLEGLDPEAALARVPQLAISKVAWLPAITVDAAFASMDPFPITSVIERLDPAHHRRLQPAPAPGPARRLEPEPSHIGTPAAAQSLHVDLATGADDVARAPAAASARPAHVFYSHLALQRDALVVLESIYGLGVSKKLTSIANATPPHQYPAEFLAKCREHAALMLGDRKASELFKGIEEKVTAHLS